MLFVIFKKTNSYFMKLISFFSVIFMMVVGPANCSDAKKIQKTPPMAIGKAYYESWTSEVKSEGSGYNLFIPVSEKDDSMLTLDSVYFRNQIVKLTKKTTDAGSVYIGEFKNPQPTNVDIIMSSDPMDEMANKTPVVTQKIPYELKPTEAMVSYTVNGESLNFKIENIQEKPSK